MRRIPMLRGAAALSLLMLIGGCAQVRDFIDPEEVAQQRADYVPGESAIYCYRTLATNDCYREPQAGPPNRFVMGYDNR